MGDFLPVVGLGFATSWVLPQSWHGCAGSAEGAVKCWGRNHVGQLGFGDLEDRGDGPNEMGAQLPFVDVGTGVVAMCASSASSCALDQLGRVRCWGNNDYGQLGLGDTEARGDEPGEMGGQLPYVDLGQDVTGVQVSGQANTTCAVLDTGGLKCWGATNVVGDTTFTLWPGADTYTGDEPGEMGDALVELTTGDGRAILEVGVAEGGACVRLEDGGVRCFGFNQYGLLGLGHGWPVVEWLEDIPDVDLGEPATHIAVGWNHACAQLESGNVKCWGRGDAGQLGYGDPWDRGIGPNQMGDDLPYVELF
jgi:alpha-tubulin suppressor-like RCC1 family protein